MDGGAERGRYRAFISYSHKDAAFGRRLHRSLESYALPKRLVGLHGPRRLTPAKFAPVFRDRDELPAHRDLTEKVRAALDAADALIVVCSPNASASPWVALEIETFRALHPDAPMLAALIDGEPRDAFPAALRAAGPDGLEIEPLAADFRRSADGQRLALLKLVAGALGLGLDELVQRDAQRQVRRVTAVTAAALAVAVSMGLTTTYALQARAEALRQRAEAEGLIEFMLTDLRDRLDALTQLDVLTSVNARALRYYQSQDIRRLPPDSLARRAKILRAMGIDDEQRGEFDRAMKEFLEARRTTGALLKAAPDDPERVIAHAQSEYYVAFIHWRKHEFAEAQAGHERYAALAERAVRLAPQSADAHKELGDAESNLGMMALRDRADPASALPLFQRSLAHLEFAARAAPGDQELQREVADGYAWLADTQKTLGRYDEAQESREAERRLLEAELAKDPRNRLLARDLLGNALGLARIDLARGRYSQAGVRLERSEEHTSELQSH